MAIQVSWLTESLMNLQLPSAIRTFTPPAWFGVEVTEDPRYRNVSLAVAHEPPG